uniref:ZP domain-containing protein n=1 Tax=Caenorhabditis tropicalis TaxID=1561998 RepID=A0A1I7U654_9PELO
MLKFVIYTLFLLGTVSCLDKDAHNELAQKLNLKLQKYSSFALPEVSERYQPEFPEKARNIFDTNPITCYNKSVAILPHDGTAKFGDLIESDFSSTCSDTFTFYVDNFINEFFVIVNTLDALNPRATIYNPIGGEVASCKDYSTSATQTVHLICNGKNLHGTGAYTVKLAADMNKPCIFEIRAPTLLTVDGGFVEDIRDDDVQQIIFSTANQGIFRFPLENQASYLAFKVESEEFPIHPDEVHLYANGLFDLKMDLNLRYGCNTPHITQQSYNCTSQNLYHAKFRGVLSFVFARQKTHTEMVFRIR